jgi:hypothetical protein
MLPLPHYGWNRAPRPPPHQHRVPIRAAAVCCEHQLIRITPGLLQSQAKRFSGVNPWTVLFVLAATCNIV